MTYKASWNFRSDLCNFQHIRESSSRINKSFSIHAYHQSNIASSDWNVFILIFSHPIFIVYGKLSEKNTNRASNNMRIKTIMM